jgi:rhodanese-related sulfurtransferase
VHDFESLYLNGETGEPLPRRQSPILVIDIRPAAANSAGHLASSSINVPVGEYLQGERLHPDALRLKTLVCSF